MGSWKGVQLIHLIIESLYSEKSLKPNDPHYPSENSSNPQYPLCYNLIPNKKSDFQSNSSLLQQNGVRGRPFCGLVLIDLENRN